ncbi:glycosyltransferase family 2 protein [Jannaschia rubra]|uniref:Glycosyl transferase family 2 n=1 Tax=Jannaschia rubra TaxID=282197 RepID=A0A0M6XPG1_9RHOB|nr:glycosyltransferase [Jannaschia rubra]CTQ32497.1 Glycosyl transferase family 2 [Jannaschia rubra]
MPKSSATPNICAIVCIRNEDRYLKELVEHLEKEGIEAFFIDNGSTDGSRETIEKHIGGNVLGVRDLPHRGSFSLVDQLQAKAEVEQTLRHEWVMHVDADEIHHASSDGTRLVDVAGLSDEAGCNVVNFEEFVFLPEADHDGTDVGAHLDVLRYYYFAPVPERLLRLYRRGQGLDNRPGAGHRLRGDARIYPQPQVLRHYITLDQDHLLQKYVGRAFDPSELGQGWHHNRVGLTAEMLSLSRADHDQFEYLPARESRAFIRDRPRKRHFWSW